MGEDYLPSTPAWVSLARMFVLRLPAGRYRALHWLGRRSSGAFLTRMPPTLGGSVFHCDLRDSIAREVCFTGRYEPQETALVQAVVRPGMTFVDVGANWGYFTLYGAHLVAAEGRVISLEPDPRLFAMLRDNIRRNELFQVSALPIAAADEAGTLTLAGYDEQSGNWGLSKVVRQPAGAATFEVAAQPLDDLLDKMGVGSVAMVKMDIEGAEELALRGMQDGLAEQRYRCILLEVHPTILAERGCTVEEVYKPLLMAGYRAWRLDHSPQATRRAAYARTVRVTDFLQPADLDAALDAWPHLLWLAPALELEHVV